MAKAPLSSYDRAQLIDEVTKRMKQFEITEEEILTIMELQQRNKDARQKVLKLCQKGDDAEKESACEARTDSFEDLVYGLESLSKHKRHDLMCLVYLGMNITWYGFTQEAVADFTSYTDEWGTKPEENLRGSIDPRYLAGKPMVEWLRAVKKEISTGVMPDDEWRITIYYTDDSEKTLVFRDYDEAWDVFRSFVIQESLRAITSVCFRGYSWTGRAVTRIAQLEYRR